MKFPVCPCLSLVAMAWLSLSAGAQTAEATKMEVQGVVRSLDYGGTIPGAEVTLTHVASQKLVRAKSDASGSFHATVGEKGIYIAIARAEGYASSASVPVEADPGRSSTVALELEKPGSLIGHVADAESRTPLHGIRVRALWTKLSKGKRSRQPIGREVVTDAKGAFRIPDLPVGSYVIEMVTDDAKEALVSEWLPEESEESPRELGYTRQLWPQSPDQVTMILSGSDTDMGLVFCHRRKKTQLRGKIDGSACGSTKSITVGLVQQTGELTVARTKATLPCPAKFTATNLGIGRYQVLAFVQGSGNEPWPHDMRDITDAGLRSLMLHRISTSPSRNLLKKSLLV